MIGPYHSPGQQFKDPAPHLMEDVHVVWIGLQLGINQFFSVDTITTKGANKIE